MKKKTALLLSSVMLLSSIPNTATVHAVSATGIDRDTASGIQYTVFVEQSGEKQGGTYDVPDTQSIFGADNYWYNNNTTSAGVVIGWTENSVIPSSGSYTDASEAPVTPTVTGIPNTTNSAVTSSDVKAREVAPYLTIDVNDAIPRGTQVSLELSNAEWFFRNAGAASGNSSYTIPELSTATSTEISNVEIGWGVYKYGDDRYKYLSDNLYPLVKEYGGIDLDGNSYSMVETTGEGQIFSAFPGNIAQTNYSKISDMDADLSDNTAGAYKIYDGDLIYSDTDVDGASSSDIVAHNTSYLKWNGSRWVQKSPDDYSGGGDKGSNNVVNNNGNFATYDMTHGYVATDPSRQSGSNDMIVYVRATYDNGNGLTPIDRNDLSSFGVSSVGTGGIGQAVAGGRATATTTGATVYKFTTAVSSGYGVTNSKLSGYILPPNGVYSASSSAQIALPDGASSTAQIALPAGAYAYDSSSAVIVNADYPNNWYANDKGTGPAEILWDHNISHKINDPNTQYYNNVPLVLDLLEAGDSSSSGVYDTLTGVGAYGIANPELISNDGVVAFEPIYTLTVDPNNMESATIEFTTDFFNYNMYDTFYNDPEQVVKGLNSATDFINEFGGIDEWDDAEDIYTKATMKASLDASPVISTSTDGKLAYSLNYGLDSSAAYTGESGVEWLDYNPTNLSSKKPSNIQHSSDPRVADSVIVIPLVVRTTAPGTASVTISSTSTGFITPKTISFADGVTVRTESYLDSSIVSGRSAFYLDDIVVEERGYGVLRSGIFELEVPDGYYFNNNFHELSTSDGNNAVNNGAGTTSANGGDVYLNFYGGLENNYSNTWENKLVAVRYAPDFNNQLATRGTNYSYSNSTEMPWQGNGNNLVIDPTTTTSALALNVKEDSEQTKLQFRIQVKNKSTSTTGKMVISNLVLNAEDVNDMTDETITLDIRSISADIPLDETGWWYVDSGGTYDDMNDEINTAFDPDTDAYLFVENAYQMNMFERWSDSDNKGYYLGYENDFDEDCLLEAETLEVAKRANWDLTFTQTEDIPTLIAGRYSPYEFEAGEDFDITWDNGATVNADDATHKVAQIKLQENAMNAWWSERITTFTLSEGIAIRKVEFGDSNLNNNGEAQVDEGGDSGITADALTLPKTGGGTYYSTDWNNNTEFFPNDGVNHHGIKVDGNVITVTDARINSNKLGTLYMDVWVSIPVDYIDLYGTDEITMTCTGSSIPDQDESTSEFDGLDEIVVAYVQAPVTIDTEVTDVRIGYQYYSVADIVISETDYAMLRKGKELKVSVTDFITDDIVFTPGIVPTTEGFELSEMVYGQVGSATDNTLFGTNSTTVTTTSTNTLYFEVSKQSTSSTGAGSLTLENVQVKIDRTVPESMESYKLVVWGTAIAENYGPFRDQFAYSPGLTANYVNIVTSAPDNSAVSSSVVLVEIGATEIVVGREVFAVDVPAFVDATTNSTMVPIRYVSLALGIAEEKVIWDPEKSTVTIDASTTTSPRIVQMTTGSDQVTINGMSRTMYAADGVTPVSMLISGERSFIPFRALGEALGVDVAWDAENSIAIFNPAKVIEGSTAWDKLSDSYKATLTDYVTEEEAEELAV